MTILVTGATGTVGRSLVAQLLAAGHAVRALTRRPASAASTIATTLLHPVEFRCRAVVATREPAGGGVGEGARDA